MKNPITISLVILISPFAFSFAQEDSSPDLTNSDFGRVYHDVVTTVKTNPPVGGSPVAGRTNSQGFQPKLANSKEAILTDEAIKKIFEEGSRLPIPTDLSGLYTINARTAFGINHPQTHVDLKYSEPDGQLTIALNSEANIGGYRMRPNVSYPISRANGEQWAFMTQGIDDFTYHHIYITQAQDGTIVIKVEFHGGNPDKAAHPEGLTTLTFYGYKEAKLADNTPKAE